MSLMACIGWAFSASACRGRPRWGTLKLASVRGLQRTATTVTTPVARASPCVRLRVFDFRAARNDVAGHCPPRSVRAVVQRHTGRHDRSVALIPDTRFRHGPPSSSDKWPTSRKTQALIEPRNVASRCTSEGWLRVSHIGRPLSGRLCIATAGCQRGEPPFAEPHEFMLFQPYLNLITPSFTVLNRSAHRSRK
jgi:hypothetical protein